MFESIPTPQPSSRRADGAEPNTSTSQRRRSGAEGATFHFCGAAKLKLHGALRGIEELAEQLTSEQVLNTKHTVNSIPWRSIILSLPIALLSPPPPA
jgi:hypothetical protein